MRSRSDMIAYALARAPSDSDKAEDVLSFFCDAVENGEPPDPRILAYLAERFRLMVGGRPVEQKPVTPDNKPGNPEKRGNRRHTCGGGAGSPPQTGKAARAHPRTSRRAGHGSGARRHTPHGEE